MSEQANQIKTLTPQEIETLKRLAQKSDEDRHLKVAHNILNMMIGQAMRLNSEIDSAIQDQEEIKSCADTAKCLVGCASNLFSRLSLIAEKGGQE